jgi:hypothetical protein
MLKGWLYNNYQKILISMNTSLKLSSIDERCRGLPSAVSVSPHYSQDAHRMNLIAISNSSDIFVAMR